MGGYEAWAPWQIKEWTDELATRWNGGNPPAGRCCGAPAEPVATAKFAQRHKTGLSFGLSWPCRRAAACETLAQALRRAGGPALSFLSGDGWHGGGN